MNSTTSSPQRVCTPADAHGSAHVQPGSCKFQPEPGQWIRFTMSAALFPSRGIRLVLAGITLLACFCSLVAPNFAFGIAACLAYVGTHLGLSAVAAMHTVPSRTFWACPKGVRLGDGAFIPQHHVNCVVCRDILRGPVVVSGLGKIALTLSTRRRPLGWLYRRLLTPIAFQVELDVGGTVHVVVGRVSQATARQIHETLSRVLKFSL